MTEAESHRDVTVRKSPVGHGGDAARLVHSAHFMKRPNCTLWTMQHTEGMLQEIWFNAQVR